MDPERSTARSISRLGTVLMIGCSTHCGRAKAITVQSTDPLDPAIVHSGDDGTPIVLSESEAKHSEIFLTIAERMIAELPAPRLPLSIV